jgi:hypothetical protein
VIQYNISIPEVLLAAVSSLSLRVLEVLTNYESDALYLIRRPIDWHLEELSVTAAMVEYSDFSSQNAVYLNTICWGTYHCASFCTCPLLAAIVPPKLERLMCYPMLLPHLIPGHVVNDICTFDQCVPHRRNPPLEPDELAALLQSAAHLEMLQIQLSHMIQLTDGDHFPHLQMLIVEYDVGTRHLIRRELPTPSSVFSHRY